MDGLLVDTEPLWFTAEAAVMKRLHGAWDHGDQVALVGGSMAKTVAYLLQKGTRPAQPAAVSRWLLHEMVDLLGQAPAPVLPGAVELVTEVQSAGLPYALVTSSEPEVVDAVLAKLDVVFPVIVCAADVSHTKPDPEGYLLAAAKLGVDPQQAIALEDSVTGLQAAEAAGYRTVAVPSVVPVPQRPGRVVLDTLAGVTLAQLATRAGFAL
jgi:HAD superfamily hydrolase (TIGR01509 family)